MKKLLITLFISLISISAFSQNYNLLYPGRIANYKHAINQDTMIMQISLHVDSIAGADTTWKNFSAITLESGAPFTMPPWRISDTSFFSYKYGRLSNGAQFFLNTTLDTIQFQTQASSGNSWRMYTYSNSDYILATIQLIQTQNFLNVTDSVKEISLQRYDSSGTPLPDSINSLTLQLSQSYGLLNLPDFRQFPVLGNTYLLSGFDSTSIGVQSLTMAEIFDFDIGDIFHYYKSYSGNIGHHVEYYHRTILNKVIDTTNTTIRYTVRDSSVNTTEYWGGGSSVYLDIMTATSSLIYSGGETIFDEQGFAPYGYYYSSYIDRLTGYMQDIGLLNEAPLTEQFYTPDYNSRMLKQSIQRVFRDYPDTFKVSYDTIPFLRCNFRGTVFGKGLGYVKNSNDIYSVNSGCPDSMIYFKKGNETWGNPTNLMNILKSEMSISNFPGSYFPNPFNDKLILKNLSEDTRRIQLFSIDGNLLDEIHLFGQSTYQFNTQNLPSGIYILSIATSIGQYHAKVIKAE